MAEIAILEPRSFFMLTDPIEKAVSDGELGVAIVLMDLDHDFREEFWGEEEAGYFLTREWYAANSEFKTNVLLGGGGVPPV